MIELKRTTSDNADFKRLTDLFDAYLVEIDSDEKDFFAQYNQIYIKNVIVLYENDYALGCGAFKGYENGVAELKRMFVLPESRGKGIASKIVDSLESWMKEEGFSKCILETSHYLEPAVALYKKLGFTIIPNYGPYKNVSSSICMQKMLTS